MLLALGMAQRFEELVVWQLAKEIAVLVYKLGKEGALSKDWGFKDQMQRSALSISSNIAEGYERDSEKDDIRMLYIAKGSAGELRSQVLVATEVNLIPKTDAERLVRKCVTVSALLSNLIKAKRRGLEEN